jgi:hypothetical protein
MEWWEGTHVVPTDRVCSTGTVSGLLRGGEAVGNSQTPPAQEEKGWSTGRWFVQLNKAQVS